MDWSLELLMHLKLSMYLSTFLESLFGVLAFPALQQHSSSALAEPHNSTPGVRNWAHLKDL